MRCRAGRGIIFRKTFIGIYKAINLITCPFKCAYAGAGCGYGDYFDSRSRCADDYEYPRHTRDGRVYSSQRADVELNLVFLASLVLVFVEIYCAFSLVKGRSWARWVYLATQIIVSGYLWAASLGYGYPELFSIAGESKRDILHSLVMQKLPDL